MQHKAITIRYGDHCTSEADRRKVRLFAAAAIIAATTTLSGCDSLVVRHNGTEIEIHDRQLPEANEGIRDPDLRKSVADIGPEG